MVQYLQDLERLHQIYFNSTSTLFVNGIPSEVGIFSNDSPVAIVESHN
jgi:hypothetical protein